MLRVNPTGTMAWYVQLDRNRKRKIGDTTRLTASVARYRARDLMIRAARLKKGKRAGRDRTLGGFLNGRYSRWIGRKSAYGGRDTRRLSAALGELNEEPIDQVGISKIERWKLKRLGAVSPATFNRELASLRKALDKARDWRLLTDNPARRIKLRKETPRARTRYLTPTERKRLHAALVLRQDHIGPLVRLALNTGLSKNELFGLLWRDVYLGPNPSISVQKSGSFQNKNRKIPINQKTVDCLVTWQERSGRKAHLVFPGQSGARLRSISTAWKRLTKEARISNFRFSDCRHDFAVRLVSAGVPLPQVRDLLGHSSIALTERYAAFAPGSPGRAIAALGDD
jgi:integrase